MRSRSTRKLLLPLALIGLMAALLLPLSANAAGDPCTEAGGVLSFPGNGRVRCTFAASNSEVKTFVVPSNAFLIDVVVDGARGGTSTYGGLGARVSVTNAPQLAGQSVRVQVGAGGGNGGSRVVPFGGPSTVNGARGGGASAVWLDGAQGPIPLLVAGGGGGGNSLSLGGNAGSPGTSPTQTASGASGSPGVGATGGAGGAGGLIPTNFTPPVMNPGSCLSSWPDRIPNNGFAGQSHVASVIANGGAGGNARQNPGNQFAGGYAGHGGGAGYAGGGGGGPSDYCSWSEATGRLRYYSGRPGGGAGGSSFANGSYFPFSPLTILEKASAPSDGPGQVTFTYFLAPAVSSMSAPSTLRNSPFVVSFNVPVRGVTTSTLFASQADNPTPGVGSLSCLDVAGTSVNCVDGPVLEARYTLPQPLIPGEYYQVHVNTPSSGIVAYDTGTAIPPTQQTFRAKTSLTAFDYPVTYQWAKTKADAALGGSYVKDSSGGSSVAATITLNSTSEPTLVLWGGRAQGRADISVSQAGTTLFSYQADTYRPTKGPIFESLGTLAQGKYRVTVSVSGTKNAASNGTTIGVDGLVANGITTNTPKLVGMWPNFPGNYAYNYTAGTKVSMTFRGTGIDWTAFVGPNNGHARVAIDGVVVDAAKDLYAPGYSYQTFNYGGLSDSVHTIVITCLGKRSVASSDNVVTLGGLTVH